MYFGKNVYILSAPVFMFITYPHGQLCENRKPVLIRVDVTIISILATSVICIRLFFYTRVIPFVLSVLYTEPLIYNTFENLLSTKSTDMYSSLGRHQISVTSIINLY